MSIVEAVLVTCAVANIVLSAWRVHLARKQLDAARGVRVPVQVIRRDFRVVKEEEHGPDAD